MKTKIISSTELHRAMFARRSLGWALGIVLLCALPMLAQESPRRDLAVAATSNALAVAPESGTLVLVSPLESEFVYLINARGEIRHQWKFEKGGNNAYLFPDGTLMRGSQEPEISLYAGRGSAGRIQKVDWEGKLLWDFKYANEHHLQHHDFEVLPNGNVLLIAWEKHTREEALQAGRDPNKLSAEELYSEKIVEIQPQGLTGGKEVWQWRLWDHLIQNHDPQLPNFGQPQQHPRRVDVNFLRSDAADWIHMNAVDYHAQWDQIILSARYFDELWVIDHSTSAEQAATSSGGTHAQGGDLLYRMGNPMAYGQGALNDKQLFGQHNCMWIPKGFPGEGNVTIFNNGTSAPREGYSSVDEFRLPVNEAGRYRMTDSGAFENPVLVWSYARGNEMFSFRISGAERLANGNTLICSGDQPWILEVSPDKQVVWETRQRLGGEKGDSPNREKGAMFRAPGYAMEFFVPEIQAKLK